MFAVAFLLGIYSYSIFFLGLLGILYYPLVIVFTILFMFGSVYWHRKEVVLWLFATKQLFKKSYSPFFLLLLVLLVLQMLINVVGALGPELGFDALWYHLTLPKLYLEFHMLLHFPGGLLYYSDMPKLTEMMYTGLLSFGTPLLPKLLHFTFGILCAVVLYRIARKFLSSEFSLLSVLLFYTNLVVGWESISAYIDLSVTFFTLCSLLAFFDWLETKHKELLVKIGLFLGLAMAAKLFAFETLAILLIAVFLVSTDVSLLNRFRRVVIIAGVALLIPLPWLAFSYIHTHNPFYPLFTPISHTSFLELFNPLFMIQTLWITFTHAPDPISPFYFAIFPLVFVYWRQQEKRVKLLFWLGLGFLIAWYLIPFNGETRYLLPYLPLFSLLGMILLSLVKRLDIKVPLLIFFFITVAISLVYRGAANAKFIPVLLGRESQAVFLAKHLTFSYGDFYDTDGYFATHIKPTDTVLLFGFHNLFYVDFPFIDSSWVKKGDRFDYIAVQGRGLPKKFAYWHLIYLNPVTQVRLYSLKGYPWYW